MYSMNVNGGLSMTSVHVPNPSLAMMARMLHVFLLPGLSGVESRAETCVRTDKRPVDLPEVRGKSRAEKA